MLLIGNEIFITVRLFRKMSTPESPRRLDILIAVEITSILIKVPGTRPELRYGTDVFSQMLALRRHHSEADQHVYCFRRGDAGFAAVEKIVQEIEKAGGVGGGGGCCVTPEIRLEDEAAARPGWDPKDMSESHERSASRTQ